MLMRRCKPAVRTFFACLVLLSPALASAATLGLHVGSRHDRPGFDDANVGVYGLLDNGLTLGTFNNSESRQSFYIGKTWQMPLAQRLDAGVTLGAITGYDRNVSPLVVPSLALELGQGVKLRSALLLKVNRSGANAVHLMLEKEFR